MIPSHFSDTCPSEFTLLNIILLSSIHFLANNILFCVILHLLSHYSYSLYSIHTKSTLSFELNIYTSSEELVAVHWLFSYFSQTSSDNNFLLLNLHSKVTQLLCLKFKTPIMDISNLLSFIYFSPWHYYITYYILHIFLLSAFFTRMWLPWGQRILSVLLSMMVHGTW